MIIQESAENYLEAILMLRQQHGAARAVDVAAQLGVSKPSVSYAVKRLRENGYIKQSPNSALLLTTKGEEIAVRIYERHRLIEAFLQSIGVSEKTAKEDACRIEHAISEETFEHIKKHASEKR